MKNSLKKPDKRYSCSFPGCEKQTQAGVYFELDDKGKISKVGYKYFCPDHFPTIKGIGPEIIKRLLATEFKHVSYEKMNAVINNADWIIKVVLVKEQ